MRLRRRKFLSGDDEDPMGGMTNLVDIMLVFAIAIMLVALQRWSVDLGGVPIVRLDPETLVSVGDLETLQRENDGFGVQTDQAERVYVDTKTGEMFVVR